MLRGLLIKTGPVHDPSGSYELTSLSLCPHLYPHSHHMAIKARPDTAESDSTSTGY